MAVTQPFDPDVADRLVVVGVRRPSATAGWTVAASVVLGLSLLAAVAQPVLHHQAFAPEDDAEYYRVIARHIASSGVSTFDGQTLTNGYHPLWTWLLAAQDRLFGDSFLITRLIEVVLVAGAFPLVLARSGLKSALGAVVFLIAFGRLVAGLALTGMEVSLLVATVGLLLWSLAPEKDAPLRRGPLIGLALAASVLARLDAAVFVLPLVALAPLKRSTRLVALETAGAIGAAYVAYNLAVFGAAMPLSSAVKSLGGLQLNHRFLDQLVEDWRTSGLISRYVQTFGLLAISPLFLLASKPNSLGRAIAAATVVGGLAFTAKIAFDSSWRIWPWYNFPVLFGLLAAAFTLGPRLEAWAGAWTSARDDRLRTAAPPLAAALAAVLLAGLCAKAGLTLARPAPNPPMHFDQVNVEAIRRFGPVLKNQRIAMGDRAGVFAAAYPGGVTQLEGLVNDRPWFDALKAGADLKPILCARGVRFVAAYQKDLGPYREAAVPAMRPRLTQFAGPVLRLAAADEVGHFADRSVFDMRGVEDEDDVFYLWRLTCGPVARHDRGRPDVP